MKNIVYPAMFALTSILFTPAPAEAANGCYARIYGADHMANHPGQIFDQLRVDVREFSEDGGFTSVSVSGMRPGTAEEYHFEAIRPAKPGKGMFLAKGKPLPANAYCAPATGDGQEYSGCLQLTKDSNGNMIMKPLRLDYVSLLGTQKVRKPASPMTLIYCKDNASTDGEGCPENKTVKAELNANDSETGTWRLGPIDCSAKLNHPSGQIEGAGGWAADPSPESHPDGRDASSAR